jgi:hypothetical protein
MLKGCGPVIFCRSLTSSSVRFLLSSSSNCASRKVIHVNVTRSPTGLCVAQQLREVMRAAGEAVLTRGRRSETVTARELPSGEAALVMREDVKGGNPFARNYGVTADSSLEEFERAVVSHPLFVLERK